jgi:hypothetical protein
MANILVKWEIGRCINSYYQGKYGTNELGKISTATGIGRDTLVKTCKFAKQYSKEHVEMLLKGRFVMSWYQIAQHLTVEPQKVINTYHQSPNQKQFNYGIIKLKSPSETRGKSRSPKIIKEKPVDEPIMVAPEIIPEEEAIAEYHEPSEAIDPNEPSKHYEACEKELAILKLENERLRKEISDRDQQIDSMNEMMKENDIDIKDKELLLAAYRDRIKRVRYMIENNFGVSAIMELLVTVV